MHGLVPVNHVVGDVRSPDRGLDSSLMDAVSCGETHYNK